MENRVGEMRAFTRVVEAGSFSEAARQLRMAPSTISKLISRIEDRYGVRLIERSTRRLLLTAEGQLFYARSLSLLADLDDIEQVLLQGGRQTAGIVRVNASVAFGTLGLEPILPEFWASYPNIVIDLSLSDKIVDLYLDRTDVAFRVGPLQDSSLTAQRLGFAQRKIVAAPEYLERRGTPRSIADLANHDRIGFNFPASAATWPQEIGDSPSESPFRGSLLADNGETVRRMALGGVGLAQLGDYHVRSDLAAGRLVEVLPDIMTGRGEPLHALYLGGARIPQRVRVFLDFAVPRLKAFLAAR